MKTHCIRLKKGDDLENSIKEYCEKFDIDASIVLSSAGCVTKAVLRDASGVDTHTVCEDMEIININGTASKSRIHLHISLSKKDLSVIAGHLMQGCIVNTTCELVLLQLDDVKFLSVYDKDTGYEELDIQDINTRQK